MPSAGKLSTAHVGEETAAHLGLLLRLAGHRLNRTWRLVEDDTADLVLLETRAGKLDRKRLKRCQESGALFAIICDPDTRLQHPLLLRRPLKLNQLVSILNATDRARAEESALTAVVSGSETDFYNRDWSDGGARENERNRPLPDPVVLTAGDSASGQLDPLDLLIHGDPITGPAPDVPAFDPDATLEPVKNNNSARHRLRRELEAEASASLLGVAPLEVEPIRIENGSPHGIDWNSDESSGIRMSELLKPGALFSPTRLSADALPNLVLDPKPALYYSTEPLEKLFPWTGQPSSARTEAISGNQLQSLRNESPGRPFIELFWLQGLADARGHLDATLDPGGSYQLLKSLRAAPGLQSHARIAALMTAAPQPLHAIARTSGARMEEVFGIVSAYHAIGWLKCIPRQSLQEPSEAAPRGLFARFFGG